MVCRLMLKGTGHRGLSEITPRQECSPGATRSREILLGCVAHGGEIMCQPVQASSSCDGSRPVARISVSSSMSRQSLPGGQYSPRPYVLSSPAAIRVSSAVFARSEGAGADRVSLSIRCLRTRGARSSVPLPPSGADNSAGAGQKTAMAELAAARAAKSTARKAAVNMADSPALCAVICAAEKKPKPWRSCRRARPSRSRIRDTQRRRSAATIAPRGLPGRPPLYHLAHGQWLRCSLAGKRW